MNVAQLIEVLQKAPKDAEVALEYPNDDGDELRLGDIDRVRVVYGVVEPVENPAGVIETRVVIEAE